MKVELFPHFEDISESLFEAHKREQKNRRSHKKSDKNTDAGATEAKRQKRVESSGHRGSFYNKYKYWRAELNFWTLDPTK